MTRVVRLLALTALLGCSDLTAADGDIVAVETIVPSPAEIAIGDSLQLTARALDRNDEVIPAEITWATPDTTIITVNGATGVVTGVAAGTGRVQATVGSLSSALVTVTVKPPSEEAVRQLR